MDNIIQHVVNKDEMLVVRFTKQVSPEEFERINDQIRNQCFHRNIDVIVLPFPATLAEESERPVTLEVPVGNYKETDLIVALNDVATHFQTSATRSLGSAAMKRAVNWLHAKFGGTP